MYLLPFPNTRYMRAFYLNYTKEIPEHFKYQMFLDAQSRHFVRLSLSTSYGHFNRIKPYGIRSFYIMARNMRNIEFVNITISEAQKKEFLTWADKSADDSLQLVSHLCDAGYKMSASYDGENGCYIIAVTGKADTPFNKDRCFTSRSDDMVEAVLIALYKHWVMADNGDWEKIATTNNNWG